MFVLAIDAVWRPLECIKNKVTVRCACLNVCMCESVLELCTRWATTLLLLPKSMNSDSDRDRRTDRACKEWGKQEEG